MMAQSAVYTVASVLQLLGAVLVIPFLTRFFSAAEFGLVVSMLLVTQILGFLTAFGLPVAVGREFHSRDQGPVRSRQILGAMIPISIAVGAFALLTGPVWIKAFANAPFGWVAAIACAAAVPRALSLGAQSLFRASQRPVAFAATGIATGIGTQGAGLVVATVTDGSIKAFFAGYLGMQFATMMVALAVARPRLSPKFVSIVRPVLGYALPAIVHAGAGVLMVSGDRVVVERLLGLEAVGQYQVLYLVAVLALMGNTALNQAWGPQLLRRDPSERWDALLRSSGPFLRVSGFVAAGGALCAPIILPLASPYDLQADLAVTAVASIAAVGWAHYVSCSQVLFIDRKTSVLMVISPAAAALNIALNITLVPLYGLLGAAISTVAAYAFWGLAAEAGADRLSSIGWRLRDRVVPYGVAATGAFATLALPASGIGYVGRAVLLILCAAGTLHALIDFSSQMGGQDEAELDGEAAEVLLPAVEVAG